MKRLFLPDAMEGPNSIGGADFHRLARVLRETVGDTLEVFDGHGRVFDGRVLAVTADAVELRLGDARQQPAPRPLHVLQGLPKGDKLELILQKGTELGVSDFWPVLAERSIVKLADAKVASKLERWQRITEEAARQCQRADIPTVHEPRSPHAALAELPPGTVTLVLDEEERSTRLRDALPPTATGVAFAIGPEGGWSRDEVRAFIAAGATPVTLGPLVLRTETAALAAAAVVRHLEGWLG